MNDISKKINQWIRPEIRELSAYHVPDAAGFIKLDAMENPHQWPAKMRDEWLALLRDVQLNRYPDPAAQNLQRQIRQSMAIADHHNILLGNGSDEIIQMICMALAAPGRVVLAPEPGFVMYDMIAKFTQMQYAGVPLQADFSLDMPAMHTAIEQHQPAVIFLAYPNNPTGNLFAQKDIRAIIDAAPGLVVVDEAYHVFAGHSFMPMLGEYDNLLVMRTVSKMGLAGLRLGFLAGAAGWLAEFDKLRLPYNINVLTQASVEFALRHQSVLEQQAQQICRERAVMLNALQQLDGITAYASAANFILFRTPANAANQIFTQLKQNKVLIKNLSPVGGALQDCLRVTVGTQQENQVFIDTLKKILGKG